MKPKGRVIEFKSVVPIIENERDFDKVSLDFALADRAVTKMTTEMNAEIDAIKKKYAERIKRAAEGRDVKAGAIIAYARKLWNATSLEQVFNYVVIKWSKPRGTAMIEDEAETVKRLKALPDGSKYVRVIEEIKKDDVKRDFTEGQLLDLGIKIAKPDPTATASVNLSAILTKYADQPDKLKAFASGK
jgi:phage host-nuclease inhibitor protein Gam